MKTYEAYIIENTKKEDQDGYSLHPSKHYLESHQISHTGLGLKSTGMKTVPSKAYDVHYKGEKIGTIQSGSANKDKKSPGSRIVSSRKTILKYHPNIVGRSGFDPSLPSESSVKEALNAIKRNHKK